MVFLIYHKVIQLWGKYDKILMMAETGWDST